MYMKYLITFLALGGLALNGTELLPNGTFEQRFKEWRYPDWAGKPEPGQIVADTVYGGNFAYRMGREGDKQNDLYAGFRPEPGKSVQVSMMLKGENLGENDVEIRILRSVRGEDGKSKVLGWANNPAGSGVNLLAKAGGSFDWKEVRFVIDGREFPENVTQCSLYFKRADNGKGFLWIDEVSVQSLDEKPSAVNKLADWQYEKWRNVPEPGGIDRAVSRTGGGSYAMFRPGQQGVNLYQRIPWTPGQGVKITFFLKADGVAQKDVTIRLLAQHSGQNRFVAMPPGSGVNVLGTYGGDFDWKEVTLTIPADAMPFDGGSLLLFINRADNGRGKLFIDDLTVEPLKAGPEKAVTNLFPADGSFEGGNAFFPLPPDEAFAFHGRRSARIDAALGGVSTGYLFRVMRPNLPYTLSGYARADKPGALEIRANSNRYEEIGAAKLDLPAGEWKRFAVRLKPQNQVSSFGIRVEKPEGVTVWLDALQLAEGNSPGAYAPEAPLSAGIDRTGAPGEIVFAGGQPLRQSVRVFNNLDRPLNVKVRASLDSFGGEEKELFAGEFALKGGEPWVKELTLLDAPRTGYHVLRLRAEAEGKTYSASFPVAVTPPPVAAKGESFFGLHPMGPTSPEILSRIGVKATRDMPGWGYTPEKDGAYQFSAHRFRYADAGMAGLMSIKIGNVPARLRIPGKPFADFAEANRFAKQMVEFYSPKIRDWEIENEPDLVWPGLYKTGPEEAAREYAAYVNSAAPVIKAVRPGLRLLASGVSGVDFNAGFPFTRTVLKEAGGVIDIIPVHPYANARYVGADRADIGPEANEVYRKTRDLQRMIAEAGGRQPVWFGEIGWALDVDADYLSDAALRHAQYLSRLMLIGKALGVEKVMYFLADFCIEKERFYYGIWRNTLPLPAALAYAASARMLEDAIPYATVSNSDIQCFVYRNRDGRPLAALWTANGAEAGATLPLDAKKLAAFDLFGAPLKLEKAEIKLSGSPVYLLYDGETGAFADALKQSKYDLPPVEAGWRLRNASSLELTLTNLRSAPVEGRATLSGADWREPERAISIAPGKTQTLVFDSGSSLNGRELTLGVKSNLGELNGRYRAEFLSCPAGTPVDFARAELPETGRLPRMASRDYLIPNDPENGYEGAEDLSVESAVRWDAEKLYLAIDVRDDIHRQENTAERLWAGDSIQFALDTRADALPNVHSFGPDDYELSFGLTKSGPAKAFEYLYERGRRDAALAEVECNVFRKGDTTCYRIAVPWKTLKLKPFPGMIFGMNFIANDDDGHGRNYWMGLTPGIGEAKNPYAYRKFVLE